MTILGTILESQIPSSPKEPKEAQFIQAGSLHDGVGLRQLDIVTRTGTGEGINLDGKAQGCHLNLGEQGQSR